MNVEVSLPIVQDIEGKAWHGGEVVSVSLEPGQLAYVALHVSHGTPTRSGVHAALSPDEAEQVGTALITYASAVRHRLPAPAAEARS